MATRPDALADLARAWLSSQAKRAEDDLARLVAINSFTENVEGGRLVAAALGEIFTVDGLARETVPSGRFADHLVFRTRHEAAGRSPIALVGHLDTVFPPGAFEGYRRDGDLARGPGVLDMKGGLLVVAYALRAVAEVAGIVALPPVTVVVVADEEVGSPEGQGVIRAAARDAGACLVFEAGRKNDLVITRRRGTGAMTATAHGKAAHAGNAHREGANALWSLARFTDRVMALTDYDRGVTVNVGKITGGESKNTVPDLATALLDLRFESRADAEDLIRRVEAIAGEACVPGTRIELSGGIARFPMERSDASGRLFEEYAASARAVGLGGGEAGLIGGGSDASTTSALGIASIDGLGPRGIGFHTKDEQIELATLLVKASALARFLILRGALPTGEAATQRGR